MSINCNPWHIGEKKLLLCLSFNISTFNSEELTPINRPTSSWRCLILLKNLSAPYKEGKTKEIQSWNYLDSPVLNVAYKCYVVRQTMRRLYLRPSWCVHDRLTAQAQTVDSTAPCRQPFSSLAREILNNHLRFGANFSVVSVKMFLWTLHFSDKGNHLNRYVQISNFCNYYPNLFLIAWFQNST